MNDERASYWVGVASASSAGGVVSLLALIGLFRPIHLSGSDWLSVLVVGAGCGMLCGMPAAYALVGRSMSRRAGAWTAVSTAVVLPACLGLVVIVFVFVFSAVLFSGL